MKERARSTAARAQRVPALRIAVRVGFAVNGVLNIAIGLLVFGVASSGAGGGADPQGALAGLAGLPGGQVLIWVIVVGLAALGLWQLASVVGARGADPARRWAARAKLAGKGVAYLAVAAVGVRVAVDAAGGGGAEEDLAARLLSTPGGVVIVVLLGLLVLGIGGYLVVKGVRRTFRADIDVPAGRLGTATTVVGIAGYVARGIAFSVIGILFVTAAITADPAQAGGLDDALAALAALPLGSVLLVAIGVGFVAFGVYGLVRARFARL